MKVVRMGDINVSDVETGIVIDASRDELRQIGHVLYSEVAIVPMAELRRTIGLSAPDVLESSTEKESGK